jgi:tRNA A-37 threonylcarbamoyl transferase component Bud32
MTAVPEALRSALAERYALERIVGRGGMATVYLAQDVKHRRHVAVKVLRPDLAVSLGPERFLKEIEIAAQLNHPHILTLIDSGRVADVLYFVMPFIDGESLRQLLNREGCLEPERALAIGREIGEALGYAHRRGVIHRDIKPENVLMFEGHAVVADFGIAKAVIAAGTENLTRSGFPMGTPGYMSPEQAAGRTDLGPQTDVYALGAVVHEMLIGEVPGMWPTDEALRLRRLVDASPEHRDRLDRLPGGLEQTLVKALAFRPDQRFESPEAFVSALERSLTDRPMLPSAEAREVMLRAAEIDQARTADTGGVSLAGVQRIAAEVGIPPEDVRQAADALAAPEPGLTPGGVLGVSSAVKLDQFVDGEIPVSEYGVLLEEIRVEFGDIGELSETLGDSLAWSCTRGTRRTQVLVTPDRGKTRLRITDDDTVPQGVAMVPISAVSAVVLMLTGAIISGAGLEGLPTVLGAVTAGGGSFTAAWLGLRRLHRRQMEKRLDKLAGLVGKLTLRIRGRGLSDPGSGC